MRWIDQTWEEMDSATIRNCWRHTKVVGEEIDANVDILIHRDKNELNNEIEQVVRDESQRMRVECLFHHESEMQSTEPVA